VAPNRRIVRRGSATISIYHLRNGGAVGHRTNRYTECGEQTANEFVRALYDRQAELLAANKPLSDDEFYELFTRDLRRLMKAPRRTRNNQPIGPILNAFFSWDVLPATEVKIGKITLVSGNYEGPATVGVDVSYRSERHKILVHVVREDETWLVANIIYDSGKSLISHYRGIRKG
jgi:hypothetical protein